MPQNVVVTVKMIKYQDNAVEYAISGQTVDIGILGLENNHDPLSFGAVLCDPQNGVPVTAKFQAQLLTFSDLPCCILKGSQLMFHIHSISLPATIKKLLHKRSGGIDQKNPKFIGTQTSASVIIKLDRPICVELYTTFKQLGRFTLRDYGKTIGGGIITSFQTNTKNVNK